MMRSLVVSLLAASTLAACSRSPAPYASRDPKPSAPAQTSAPSAVSAALPSTPHAEPVAAAAKAPQAPVAPAPKPARADAPVRVKRLVLAKGVKDRSPVEAADTFSAADLDKLYAFVELENPERAPSHVYVTFEKEGPDAARRGASFGRVELDVGASGRWRTWAWTRGAKKPGSYAAVVRSADGKVLAKEKFEVVA